MLRALLLQILFLTTLNFAAGQCPTVTELSDGLTSEQLVIEDRGCPSILDSLSSAYHGLSVDAFKQGRLEVAIQFGHRALEVQRSMAVSAGPSLALGKTLNNIGVFHTRLRQWSLSEEYYSAAGAVFDKLAHPQAKERQLKSALGAGVAAHKMGKFNRGEGYFTSIIRDTESRNYPATLARAHDYLGDLQMEKSAFEDALESYYQAQELYGELGAKEKSRSLLLSRANASYKLGDYDQARHLLNELFPGDPLEAESELYGRATSLRTLVATRAGNFQSAEESFQENLRIADASGYPDLIAQAFDNGAEIALASGDGEVAIERTQRAISTIVPNFRASPERVLPTPGEMRNSPYKIDLLIYLGDLARAFELNGSKSQAIDALAAAAALTDDIRSGVGDGAPKLFWRDRVKSIYENAIRLCLATGQAERSFEYFERGRAILLYEALIENDRRSALPDSVRTRLNDLEVNYRALRDSALATEEASSQRWLRLNAVSDTIERYRQEIIRRFPNTLQLSTDVRTISLNQAHQNLAKQDIDVAVEFFIGKERVYALSLNNDQALLRDLGSRDGVDRLVRSWLAYFKGPELIAEDKSGFLAVGRELYQLLLGQLPVSGAEKVLIIPDGLLAYVPFAALPIGVSADAERSYLVEKTLYYAQSLTVYNYLSQHEPGGWPIVGGFAPFTVAGAGDAPILLSSAEEMEYVSAGFNAEVVTGPAATRSAIFAGLRSADVVHLATHAYATASDEESPRILSADEPIYLNDIYNLDRRHRLITLSACNTNLGEDAAGEGVLSLGRAFTAAGATGVVASLWSLNDRSTGAIMKTFYAELAGGATKPEALQRAQLSYANDPDVPAYLRTPYYWAALTYYGSGEGVAPTRGWGWVGLALAGLLLASGIIFWYRTA